MGARQRSRAAQNSFLPEGKKIRAFYCYLILASKTRTMPSCLIPRWTQLISSSSNIILRPQRASGVTVERERHSNLIYITKTYLKCCENMGLQSSQIDRRDIWTLPNLTCTVRLKVRYVHFQWTMSSIKCIYR